MTIAVSPHHYFAIFLFIIYVGASNDANTTEGQSLTANYPVDFKLPLNVQKLTETSYLQFIANLRTESAKGGSKSGNVPILPNYGNDPHLFYVILTTAGYSTTVCFRRDNLYVRGFLTVSNQWWEFEDETKRHMVAPNSKFLPFGDSYKALETNAGKNVLITNIEYTQEKLSHAVISLSKPNSKSEQAKALIYMAQMISEAARFVDISTFFGSQLEKGEYLPKWMQTLETDWGKFSTVVQCYDKYKAKYTYKMVTINGKVYENADKLRTIFGIMLKETNLNERTCGIRKIAYEEEGEGAVKLSVDIQ